jgi:hypothetical protein
MSDDARRTPKASIREPIPEAFAVCMRKVLRLIEAGEDATTIESDDLIQIRGESNKPYVLTGGLYSEEEQQFGFCFFYGDYDAGDGVDEFGTIEWYYYLSKEEIAGIADGTIPQCDMWRCAEHDCGRRWSKPDAYCPRCDFPP